nr:helix-turn-helix transcriptional regulator [Herbaspirillum sp. ASV7]
MNSNTLQNAQGEVASDEERASRVTFGGNLRIARTLLGLTQAQLAKRAGIHRPVVSVIERGDQNISINLVIRLSHAVGYEPFELWDPTFVQIKRRSVALTETQ